MISGRTATPKTARIRNEDDWLGLTNLSCRKLSKRKEHVKAKPIGPSARDRHAHRMVQRDYQNPSSSLIRTTFTRPFGYDFSVMVHVLQIRSGLLHSSQNEVLTHGVFLSNRMALTGAT